MQGFGPDGQEARPLWRPSSSLRSSNLMPYPTAALIGSFKRHYQQVLEIRRLFVEAGINILSPKGAPIIREGIPFVRFTSDSPEWSDPMVQTVTLHRILRADLVYVVAPNGYVGRTTCYEIGRIVQAMRPIYFSAQPRDLPMDIPGSHIVSPTSLIQILGKGGKPSWPFADADGGYFMLERRLANGDYIND